MTQDQKIFIKEIAKYVQKYAPQYEIKVCSPIIAQAILESGWGKSSLAAKYHNYFGLKAGTLWKGKTVNMRTGEEYTPGVHTTISAYFRVYDSMEEGIKGYFEFIQLARYSNLKGIRDPKKYLETIKASIFLFNPVIFKSFSPNGSTNTENILYLFADNTSVTI